MIDTPQPDRVFLADASPHFLPRAESKYDLRARVAFHALLADHLVIGDSQSLNNPVLRTLLVDDDQAEEVGDGDLAGYLEEGYLRIARRDTIASFQTVREAHVQNDVDDVPTAAYAAWLDRVAAEHVIPYSATAVQNSFKGEVLRLLNPDEVPPGAAETFVSALRRGHEWIAEQDVLLYRSLRGWMDAEEDRSAGAIDAYARIEGAASRAYQSALPDALDSDIAARRNSLGRVYPGALRETQASVRLPTVMLSTFLLGQLPKEVLHEAMSSSHRDRAVRQLDLMRKGDGYDQYSLLDSMTSFVEEVNRLARAALRDDERAMAVLDDDSLEARIDCGITDGDQTRVELGVFHIGDERPADGYLTLITMPESFGPDESKPGVTLDTNVLDPVHRMIESK